MHRTAQVHQAAIVQRRAKLRARRQHVFQLHCQHRRRHIAIFYRKSPAEPAAPVEILERRQLQPAHLRQQSKRPVAQPQRPQPVATRVVGHAVRKIRAHILHAQLVDQEFAQFINPRQQRLEVPAQILVAQLLKQPGVLVAHHGHTRRRRNYHRVGVRIQPHQPFGLAEGLAAEARVRVHLPAAGLPGAKLQLHAKPLQQTHHRAPCLRIQRVVIASNEQ